MQFNMMVGCMIHCESHAVHLSDIVWQHQIVLPSNTL